MKELLLVRHSLVFLFEVALRGGLGFLELVAHLLDLACTLLVEVGIVALECVHLALQARLLLALDHATFFILDLRSPSRRLQLLLLLVQVLLRLVEMATKRVDL